MLKKRALRLISHPRDTFRINRGLMALNKLLFSTSFYGYSPLSEPNEHVRLHRKLWGGISSGSIVNTNNALSLKGSLDRHGDVLRRVDDGAGKSHAMALYRQLVHDPGVVLGEKVGANLVNIYGSCKHGRPLGFSDHPVPKKMVVAVDVDEVLGSFLSALNKFIADRYSSNHSVAEYYVYEFFRIWNCSRAEADLRVHEFFKTPYFKTGIHPIPGARHALHKISSFCNLSVVTSRQNAIKDQTLEWIEKHYPGLFQEIHFGNHFALDGQSRPKSEICR